MGNGARATPHHWLFTWKGGEDGYLGRGVIRDVNGVRATPHNWLFTWRGGEFWYLVGGRVGGSGGGRVGGRVGWCFDVFFSPDGEASS